jgi:hypothetical protein
MHGWLPNSGSRVASYQPGVSDPKDICIGDTGLVRDGGLSLTDSKSITVDRTAPVEPEPRVERLVDDRMRGSR